MKKINLAALLVLIAAFTLGLAGFSLAGSADAAETGTAVDRLVGLLVTTEYLDLFDFDAYVAGNAGKLTDGGTHVIEDSTAYIGRLWASYCEQQSGQDGRPQEYVFDSVEGFSYFCAYYTDASGDYTAMTNDGAISDARTALSTTDEGESITLEGVIYLATQAKIDTLYCNPVYQTADGRVYATSGSGIGFGGMEGAGARFSTTLDQDITQTVNGRTQRYQFSITLAIERMDLPERVSVLQFDAQNTLLSRADYVPGELPETITPEPGAAYLLVETQLRDWDSQQQTSRALYAPGEDGFETFHSREDGICVAQYTALDWE